MLSMQAAAMKLDFLTVGSLTYSNVTVLGVNASDLFFNSDRGIRNVKLRLLTPDMQQKFNYDPEAAKKAEEQQAEDEQRYHDNLAAQITAEFNTARDAREAKAQAVYSGSLALPTPPAAIPPLARPPPTWTSINGSARSRNWTTASSPSSASGHPKALRAGNGFRR